MSRSHRLSVTLFTSVGMATGVFLSKYGLCIGLDSISCSATPNKTQFLLLWLLMK